MILNHEDMIDPNEPMFQRLKRALAEKPDRKVAIHICNQTIFPYAYMVGFITSVEGIAGTACFKSRIFRDSGFKYYDDLSKPITAKDILKKFEHDSKSLQKDVKFKLEIENNTFEPPTYSWAMGTELYVHDSLIQIMGYIRSTQFVPPGYYGEPRGNVVDY